MDRDKHWTFRFSMDVPLATAKTDDTGIVAIQCTSALEKPQWTTFHVFNPVARDKRGVLHTSHLNDANAIFEFGGLFHVMCQSGGSG